MAMSVCFGGNMWQLRMGLTVGMMTWYKRVKRDE